MARFAHEAHVVFDPVEHAYTVDGERMRTSVTGVINAVLPPFPMFHRLRSSSRGSRPRAKQLRKEWAEAANLGTKMHAAVETMLNNDLPRTRETLEKIRRVEDIESETQAVEHDILLRFLAGCEARGMTHVCSEVFVYSKRFHVGGSIDCVMEDKDGNLVLIDWKRTKGDLKRVFSPTKALDPISHMPNNKVTKFSLQLSFYAWLLQRNTGRPVVQLFVAHVNVQSPEDSRLFEMRPVPDAKLERILTKVCESPTPAHVPLPLPVPSPPPGGKRTRAGDAVLETVEVGASSSSSPPSASTVPFLHGRRSVALHITSAAQRHVPVWSEALPADAVLRITATDGERTFDEHVGGSITGTGPYPDCPFAPGIKSETVAKADPPREVFARFGAWLAELPAGSHVLCVTPERTQLELARAGLRPKELEWVDVEASFRKSFPAQGRLFMPEERPYAVARMQEVVFGEDADRPKLKGAPAFVAELHAIFERPHVRRLRWAPHDPATRLVDLPFLRPANRFQCMAKLAANYNGSVRGALSGQSTEWTNPNLITAGDVAAMARRVVSAGTFLQGFEERVRVAGRVALYICEAFPFVVLRDDELMFVVACALGVPTFELAYDEDGTPSQLLYVVQGATFKVAKPSGSGRRRGPRVTPLMLHWWEDLKKLNGELSRAFRSPHEVYAHLMHDHERALERIEAQLPGGKKAGKVINLEAFEQAFLAPRPWEPRERRVALL